jgi:gas vesicle protein
MNATTLTDEMLKNFVQLNREEQESILQVIKTFLSGKEKDFVSQTIEEYNEDLKAGMDGAAEGEVSTISQLHEEMKNW